MASRAINGVPLTLAHDALGRTTQEVNALGTFAYAYAGAGNPLTRQQQADSAAPTAWRYGYDAADQLTAAVHQTMDPTPVALARYGYAYDLAGNRTVEQIDDAVTVTGHDRLNRPVTLAPGGVPGVDVFGRHR